MATCNNNEMDQNKLAQLPADLYVAPMDTPNELLNFGGVTTLNSVLDGDADRVSIPVNNRGEISGTSLTPLINIAFLETVDAEKIGLLYGLELSIVSGVLQEGVIENLECIETEVEYVLKNRNANKTVVTINSITPYVNGVAGTALLNTDYTLSVNIIGETVIELISTVPTEGVRFEIDLDVTPTKSIKVESTKRYKSDRLFRFVLVSEANSKGERNIVTGENFIFEGQYTIDFNDISTAGSLEPTTGLFRGKRNSKISYEIQTIN